MYTTVHVMLHVHVMLNVHIILHVYTCNTSIHYITCTCIYIYISISHTSDVQVCHQGLRVFDIDS